MQPFDAKAMREMFHTLKQVEIYLDNLNDFDNITNVRLRDQVSHALGLARATKGYSKDWNLFNRA